MSSSSAMRNVEVQLGLAHASHCKNPNCVSKICPRLKALLAHPEMCELQDEDKCTQCFEHWELIKQHGIQCKNPACEVPNCSMFRVQKKPSNLIAALTGGIFLKKTSTQ